MLMLDDNTRYILIVIQLVYITFRVVSFFRKYKLKIRWRK